MICQVCQQREASIHYTEVVNNNVVKLELCSVCAEEKGLTPFGSPGELSMDQFVVNVTAKEVDQTDQDSSFTESCPTCNYTYVDFRKSGRLGCPDCYLHFQPQLIPLLRDLHRGDAVRHVGRGPKSLGERFEKEKMLEELRKALEEEVERENYEEAARIRDKIRSVEFEEETE